MNDHSGINANQNEAASDRLVGVRSQHEPNEESNIGLFPGPISHSSHQYGNVTVNNQASAVLGDHYNLHLNAACNINVIIGDSSALVSDLNTQTCVLEAGKAGDIKVDAAKWSSLIVRQTKEQQRQEEEFKRHNKLPFTQNAQHVGSASAISQPQQQANFRSLLDAIKKTASQIAAVFLDVKGLPPDIHFAADDLACEVRELCRNVQSLVDLPVMQPMLYLSCNIDIEKGALYHLRRLLSYLQNSNVSPVEQATQISDEEEVLISKIATRIEDAVKLLATVNRNVTWVLDQPTDQTTADDASLVPHASSRRTNKKRESYEFKLPFWLARRCYAMTITTSNPDFGITLSTYRTMLSLDSPAFKAARRGDVTAMQELITSGKAHPLDTNIDGRSLFDTAIDENKYKMARFLKGQHVNAASSIESWSWYDILGSLLYFSDGPGIHELFRTFAGLWQVFCDDEEPDDDLLPKLLGPFSGTLPHLLKAGHLGVQVIPPQQRANLALTCFDWTLFSTFLDDDLSIEEALELGEGHVPEYTTILESAAHSFQGNPESERLQNLVREILHFDEKCCEEPWMQSPLVAVLFGVSVRAGYKVHLATYRFHDYIEWLEKVGVDLTHYGWRESTVFPERASAWVSSLRHIGFVYGPKASDWKIWLAPRLIEYEMAGTFWDWVENPEEHFIPGTFRSWNSDEDETDWILEDINYWDPPRKTHRGRRRRLRRIRRKRALKSSGHPEQIGHECEDSELSDF